MSVNEYTSVATALEGLKHRGFVANFDLVHGKLADLNTHKVYAPEQLEIVEHHRFEGVSDPDDMAVVYALESREGTKGVLTDAYGAYSDPAVGAMLDILRIDPAREGPALGGRTRKGAA